MGAASCKNSKSPEQNQQKVETKNITIGIFGLDDAGKTSTVKAIEGRPTENVTPTMSSNSITVNNPSSEKNDQRVKIIDVSGSKKFRQNSWVQFYDQIHGLVFVIDASDKSRIYENRQTLEGLLTHEKLKDKPILILANKQDLRDAIEDEIELKRKLEIDRLKTKYKIDFCSALPQDNKTKVDESIRKGFSWLIRTIDENYTQLNARVMKSKNAPTTRKPNRSESDESDNRYSKSKTNNSYATKSSDTRSRITSEKLPSINTNRSKTRTTSDDDDDDVYAGNNRNESSGINGFNKKKKVLGGTNSNDITTKRSNTNETKAFRTPYEPFPEEAPWTSSGLKSSRSDDILSKLNTKSSITSDTRKRDISPLVHDTKHFTTGSLSSKRFTGSDNEDDYRDKSKLTNRFDNKFSSTTKKTTSGIYDDDDDDYKNINNRRTNTTTYNRYGNNDDDDYPKKISTTKSNKNYDSDEDKPYKRSSDRSNLNSEYRGAYSKPISHSKFNDDDDDDYKSTSKPITRSTYNTNYANTKSTKHSRYSDDDDDDHRFSSSKTKTNSKYDDDDDHPSSSRKVTTRQTYNDDDNDDYLNSSKKGNSGFPSRRFDNDDFFTSKGGSNTPNRFRKTTGYDS